jgi:hypothetical protein
VFIRDFEQGLVEHTDAIERAARLPAARAQAAAAAAG